ncbi:FAD-dependent oxidoreductase [Streptomyces sp. NPDC057684]|uniref:FAD-dependent oxidoreductase n=1 Tax=unclassified Streptomyces TaxID=2593676 RepID=UPI0036A51A79
MYDAIVVGARCAGAPTALLLARSGHRILLLERAAFPRDTLSTHFIHQPGIAALARWGLLDQLRATGCPALHHGVYNVAGISLAGCANGIEGQRAAYAPRRHILDTLLAHAAAEAGAELRENCRVTGLLHDADGRVTGVTGIRTQHRARPFTARARLVVGADGMRSAVAEHLPSPYLRHDQTLTCAYYGYWPGAQPHFEVYERAGGWVAAVPTHGEQTLVLAYFPQSRFPQIRTAAAQAHAERVRAIAPAVWERMRAVERVGPLRGTGDQLNFFRQPCGPGWVLVGDARHHKDSVTARGITDAFHQAESLARHVSGALDAGPARLDAALQAYVRDTDPVLRQGHDATLTVARLAPASRQRLALLRAVARDATLTATYFDLFAGIGTAADLYGPRLLADHSADRHQEVRR